MYAIRAARVAYDNIAAGSATGRERHTLSGAVARDMIAGGSAVCATSTEPLASSAGSTDSSTTVNARERRVASSGAGVTSLHPRECVVSTQ